MATLHLSTQGAHPGEIRMRSMMRVPTHDTWSQPAMVSQDAWLLMQSPLLAIGAVDSEGRPWVSLWGGRPGCAMSIGKSLVTVKAAVESEDPVVQIMADERTAGRQFAALGVDLEHRRRVKIRGKVAVGNLRRNEGQEEVGEVQLLIDVESALINCPKYINRRLLSPSVPSPHSASTALPLSPAALSLITSADIFFLTASTPSPSPLLSTNLRSGPPSFVRVLASSPADTTTTIAWPEYSGNRLYQTLGGLVSQPKAGLVFPDFATGDVLYLTTETEILVGEDAARLIPRSNLVVKATVTAARFVKDGLAFRAVEPAGGRSPYNPSVWPLAGEKGALAVSERDGLGTATLVARELVAPTVARLTFRLEGTAAKDAHWTAGQHVALGFRNELDLGYAHMREDDPRSLNENWVRTFTVSSSPPPPTAPGAKTFELTVRNVGSATGLLFRTQLRAGLELPVLGFAGEFEVTQKDGDEVIGFVAGGVGITPLLAWRGTLDAKRLRLLWAAKAADAGLVGSVVRGWPELAPSLQVFVSGIGGKEEDEDAWEAVAALGVAVVRRRMNEQDAQGQAQISRWFVCAGEGLKQELSRWLSGKEVLSEDFTY